MIDALQTAKIVRRALRRAFRDQGFSIRLESKRGVLNVRWTDGPTFDAVKAAVQPYQATRLEPTTAKTVAVEAWLLSDGSATFTPDAESNAELVRFGVTWIDCRRNYSPQTFTSFVAQALKQLGVDDSDTQVYFEGKPCGFERKIRLTAKDLAYLMLFCETLRRSRYFSAAKGGQG